MMEMIRYSRRGFTLVELMVVIVIIGFLAAIALPKFKQFRDSAKETQTAANLRIIQQSLEKFAVDNNSNYPFRVRYYDAALVNNAAFSPTDWTAFPPTLNSEPSFPWFSMGLFGGVHVVNADGSDNTQTTAADIDRGTNKHKVIQPNGWTYNNWYRYFNEYTDPLTAQGYMDFYPENPFLRRPMGSIMYGMGHMNEDDQDVGFDHTLPYEEVVVSPGDFVYTFFYHTDNGQIAAPENVLPGQKSYKPTAPGFPVSGSYYVDLIDSYQLWAFGILPVNGGVYVAYNNNAAGLTNRGSGKKKDWDNSGTKDTFESGVIQYFKVTGTHASQAVDKTGHALEF
jgi:type II secretion system protein G